MKSKTLSSDLTVLKKDIFRFAPLWGVYLVVGLMVVLSSMNSSTDNHTYYNAMELNRFFSPMAIISMLYALAAAQLLFGDLFRSKMCNALHAMPLRREKWFLLHLVAGLLMFLVPNLVFSLVMLPYLGEFWYLSFAWLGGMTLQYLFFFGLALFSMFCAGNRLGALAVYGIGNFFSPLLQLFGYTIYTPLLFGLSDNLVIRTRLFPLGHIMKFLSEGGFWKLAWQKKPLTAPVYHFDGFIGESWQYLFWIALAGLLLTGAALLLYRRRNLEGAGDFIVFRPLAPVFLLIYTLCWSVFFTLFTGLFGVSASGSQGAQIFLMVLGGFVGYFTGQMFLKRTVSVFRLKISLRGAALMGIFLCSLLIVRADPLRLTAWVPEPETVSSLSVNSQGFHYGPHQESLRNIKDPEKIEAVTRLHRSLAKAGPGDDSRPYHSRMTFRYTLSDGTVRTRTYPVYRDTAQAEMVDDLLSRPEFVFGYEDSWENFRNSVFSISVSWDEGAASLDEELRRSLLDALYADCLEGHMSPIWSGHQPDTRLMELQIDRDSSGHGFGLVVYGDAYNTRAWFAQHKEDLSR